MIDGKTNQNLLTSWKEIAGYLGKGVRTVQRWERELSLPVRRPAHSRHIVVATTGDLDGWIAQLQQPGSARCCNCQEELAGARETIQQMREQLARLEEERNTAVSLASAAPAGALDSSPNRGTPDGKAA